MLDEAFDAGAPGDRRGAASCCIPPLRVIAL
jgi:hypothetical protein